MQQWHSTTGRTAPILRTSNNTKASHEPPDQRGEKMNLIRNYRNWRRYRSTVDELSRLSNRELNDLGISRGDIPYVARRAV